MPISSLSMALPPAMSRVSISPRTRRNVLCAAIRHLALVFQKERDDKTNMAKKMRAVQVPHAKGPFEIVEREIPEPPPGWVRIKVQACGICHSDSLVKDGTWPGIQYPRIPGHEIIGIVDAVGSGVAGWTTGQRVGVGWHGGHCGYCDKCRRAGVLE